MKKNFDLALKSIVLYSIDTESYTDQTFNTNAEKALFVLERFDNEFNFAQNIQRYPSMVQRVAEWLEGLPTVCTVPFTNYDIICHGERIGQLDPKAIETKKDKYVDQWFLVMAWKLIKMSEMKERAEKSLSDYVVLEETLQKLEGKKKVS